MTAFSVSLSDETTGPDGAALSHPFVVKVGHGRYVQAPRLRVSWREKRRTKRIIGGMFREVEHAGWDRSQVRVQAAPLVDPDDCANVIVRVLNPYGHGAQAMQGVHAPATAAGLKGAVRRLRRQEAERLAVVDAEIAGLLAQVAGARERRALIVREGWSNGHVVRLNEAAPVGDEARWVDA